LTSLHLLLETQSLVLDACNMTTIATSGGIVSPSHMLPDTSSRMTLWRSGDCHCAITHANIQIYTYKHTHREREREREREKRETGTEREEQSLDAMRRSFIRRIHSSYVLFMCL
jgi:hypothetical protein